MNYIYEMKKITYLKDIAWKSWGVEKLIGTISEDIIGNVFSFILSIINLFKDALTVKGWRDTSNGQFMETTYNAVIIVDIVLYIFRTLHLCA